MTHTESIAIEDAELLRENVRTAFGELADVRRMMATATGWATAAGTLTATVALAEDDGQWNLDDISTSARQTGGSWVVDGVKNYVVDGLSAGLLLVVAKTGTGPRVFAVETGVHREPLVTL